MQDCLIQKPAGMRVRDDNLPVYARSPYVREGLTCAKIRAGNRASDDIYQLPLRDSAGISPDFPCDLDFRLYVSFIAVPDTSVNADTAKKQTKDTQRTQEERNAKARRRKEQQIFSRNHCIGLIIITKFTGSLQCGA